MKKQTFIIINVIVFVLAIIICLLANYEQATLVNIAFIFFMPLLFIADLLRNLSLSSEAGNIIAWAIYITISLVPSLLFLILFKKGKTYKTDYALILLTAFLFIGLYYLINPIGIAYVTQLTISSLFVTVLIAYIVLRILEDIKTADDTVILKYLRYFLYIIMAVFALGAYIGIIAAISQYKDDLINLLAGVFDAVCYLLGAYITKMLVDLFILYEKDRYHHDIPDLLKRIIALAFKTLIYIVTVQVLIGVIYLLFSAFINDLNYVFGIPFIPLLFILVSLFIMKLIQENYRLKEDNDLMI